MMKKVIALTAIIAAAGVAIPKLSTVQAVSSTNTQTSLIQSLAQKLGLSQDKVSSAFSQIDAEKTAQLTQLVADGKITAAQKDLIVAKKKELQAKREQEQKDLESWASTNSISLEYLRGFGGGMYRGKGMGKPF